MSNLPVPMYYSQFTAKERSYIGYMEEINKSISSEIEKSADKQIAANAMFAGELQSTLINNQIASEKALYNNMQELNGTLYAGFSGVSNQLQSRFLDVSRQIGVMNASMSMGFAALNTSVQKSAQAICDRLDTMNDILNNPSLTKTRELYRRVAVSYNKGFYEEARNDLLDALASNKTDYISWFLLGKTYLFGAGEFGNVIDLDAAVDALKNTVKYITPDARKQEEARALAAEMCFFLGLAQQTRAMDALHAKNEADCRVYLEQAGGSYSQSWDYSAKMLEARYNRARCKALLGDAQGAIADLEALILLDRNYCVKVCADNDFASIVTALITKLKNAAFIPAKKDYDNIKTMLAELASLGGTTEVTVPATFTEELPYFDVIDYAEDFKRIIPIVEKDLAAEQLLKVRERIARYKVCVSAGNSYTVGLKTDGTVVAVGNNRDGQCNVSDWCDIIAVVAGFYHTVGLKADGTVVAVGNNRDGQCNVSGGRDIVAVDAGDYHMVGLKTDGTVVAAGDIGDGRCNVSGWRDIVAVAAGSAHTVGLKADGTVVAVGSNEQYDSGSGKRIHCGQCDVSGWRDIAAVAAGDYHTVGLKADGTVIAVGKNDDGQCNVSGWRDIVAVAAGYNHTVGLKADGMVVAVGSNIDDQCNISDWRGIGPVSEEAREAREKAEREAREARERSEQEAREVEAARKAKAEQEAREVEAARKAKAEQEAREAEAARKAKAEQEAREAEAARKAKAAQEAKWQAQGLCKYCGGKLGGLFTKKCKSCGKEN